MLFGGKSARELTDGEIAGVVHDHVLERQHVEFKLTYDTKDNAVKLEILKDVVSFANSSGGYIIIGIRDDGSGRAQKFESLDPK
ncbi:helix-turn-helix domain-containing protein, partial [Klebsiella pneumoniae]|uniref:AlbA family DNA-binding domain-containing protein n=1 Tax=Klebsiella pneumoniae TaxID=573 RepID=UPI003851CF65